MLRVNPKALAAWKNDRTACQLGLYPGLIELVNKFGRGLNIPNGSFANLWDGCGSGVPEADDLYPWPAVGTAPITHFSSSDNADTTSLDYRGLTVDGLEVLRTLTATGQTPVELAEPLWRFQRAGVCAGCAQLVGRGYFSDGVVTAGVPDNSDKVFGIIENGNNQTLHTLFTIPRNKIGLLFKAQMSQSRGNTAVVNEVEFRGRRYGDGGFNLLGTLSLVSTGSSDAPRPYEFGRVVPPVSDITMLADASASNSAVSGAMSLVLFDLIEYDPYVAP